MTSCPNFQSNSVFIIGGGPSLKSQIDFISKRDIPIIATNNAYKLFPQSFEMLFCDDAWFSWNGNNLLETYKGKIFSTAIYKKNTDRITYLENTNKNAGLSLKSGEVFGNNAGHCALNLAIQQGFKIIFLCGFDMNSKSSETHWHNEHKRETNTTLYDTDMIPAMEILACDIQKFVPDVKVYNCSPESALTCFEKIDINKI